jgi:hypothetical protein
MNFKNVQILQDFTFHFENYHNFESYKNMLTILSFIFCIISYNFVLYVMYITPIYMW